MELLIFIVAFFITLAIIEAQRMKDCPACHGEDEDCSECGGEQCRNL